MINGIHPVLININQAKATGDTPSQSENLINRITQQKVSSSVSVSISQEGKKLSETSNGAQVITKIGAGPANGNNSVSMIVDKAVIKEGAKASILKEMPNTNDPARLKLAKQAVDFVVGTGDNPFADLSRKDLSKIAYDDSGAYTSAERAASMHKIVDMDNDFGNQVTATKLDNSTDSFNTIQSHADFIQFSGMSDAERKEKGLTEASVVASLNSSKLKSGDVSSTLTYKNLKSADDSVIAATMSKDGKTSWSSLSSSLLSSPLSRSKLLNDFSSLSIVGIDRDDNNSAKLTNRWNSLA